MKSLLPSLVVLLITFNTLSGQQTRYFETGFLLGLTSYSGDIAESTVEIKELQPGYGLYFRYHFSNHFALKAHVYSGSIAGDDANSPSLANRKIRFSTSIIEFGSAAEWHILGKERYTNTGIHNFFVTPYLFAGLGFTFADAKTEYYGDPSSEFAPEFSIPEEGLRKNFLLAPMGVGIRADILDRLVIGAEFGFRPVFSDDLDGVRQNGNPDKGDWYYFTGLTISFILSDPDRRRR